LDSPFNESRNVRSRRASKGRLGNNDPVNNRAVVVQPVTVIVDACGRIERPRGRQHTDRAGRDIVWKTIDECDYGTVALIDDTRAAFLLAQTSNDALVRINTVTIGLAGIRGFRQRVAD